MCVCFSFRGRGEGDKNVLELDNSDGEQRCEYAKKNCNFNLYTLKRVNLWCVNYILIEVSYKKNTVGNDQKA